MKWLQFLKRLTILMFLVTGGAVILLSLIGYLLAGKEGMINGATWGLLAGMISLPPMAFMIGIKYWSDYAGRYGDWYVKKETYGEEESSEQSKKKD